jgi:cadmium resistance protein CadD (predicted permease)
VFAGTNVDDIIVLTVLFLSPRVSDAPKVWTILAGQEQHRYTPLFRTLGVNNSLITVAVSRS